MAGDDWSDDENDAIVADYFDMLADDLSGRPYTKAEHNRRLQARLGRPRGSVEFKYCNVSAALRGFAQPIVTGFAPLFNFQMSLADAVDRWLTANPEWLERPPRPEVGMGERAGGLYVGTAPTLRNAPPPDEAEQVRAIALRFDIAARDECNRALGRAGEERALAHERDTLRQAGRDDLARRVVWTRQEEGDGAGYDIASFTSDGTPRLIEVKTTKGWDRTPFHISRNELRAAEERRAHWCLFRLYDFARTPKAFELRTPLDRHVTLAATTFEASFQ